MPVTLPSDLHQSVSLAAKKHKKIKLPHTDKTDMNSYISHESASIHMINILVVHFRKILSTSICGHI